MFGGERALAAGHLSARRGHQIVYHCPGKELIETSVIATLAACSIDRKQRVGFRATDRKSGAARRNENACAKRGIVAVNCSREVQTAGYGRSLANNNVAAHLRERRGAAPSNVGRRPRDVRNQFVRAAWFTRKHLKLAGTHHSLLLIRSLLDPEGAPSTHDVAGSLASEQGRPVRGRNHPPMTSCGARRQRGKPYRWTAAFAKASACWPDCRFSRASDIHSRIMARRTFVMAICISYQGGAADNCPPYPWQRATPPFAADESAISAPKARNRSRAPYPAQ